MKTELRNKWFSLFVCVSLMVSLLGSALVVTPVYAAGFTVTKTADTADGTCAADCSLREAITAANALAGADVITVPAGTYTLTITGTGEDGNATGDLDLNSDITITGAGAGTTIIQAGTLGYPDGGANGIDRVFHIPGAYTVNISGVTIANGKITGTGGGIYNYSGTLTVTNSTFSDNSATYGGGIYNEGTLTVTNSTFSGNSATYGGGIYNQGTLTVTNSTFSGNTANTGGGIYNYGTLTVTNSTFSGNAATYGGGIYNQGTLTVTNSTFSGNAATTYGGIYNQGTLNYANTIIANSTGGDCNNSATIGTNTNNLVEDGTCSPTLSGDPMLGALANNGGSTQTFALLSGSPAIDAGNNTVCAASPVSGLDQRGVTRPQGAACDIGSYEYFLQTLAFNSNGGTSVASITQDFGTAVSAPTAPTLTGYTFAGWYDEVGLTTLHTFSTMGLSATLYAKWTVSVPIFVDVPFTYWANSYIERLYKAGITGGCTTTPLNYCPDSSVTRAQMAIFLLKGIHGSSYTPPTVGISTGFTDVAVDYWAAAWIKQLAAEGITGGCGPGVYCPDATVTRAQMAVFLLKAKHGSSYNPPAASGVFSDVPIGYWADKWIEQLAAEGVTSGCGAGIYCPDADVTRAQMAVFLVKNFSLP